MKIFATVLISLAFATVSPVQPQGTMKIKLYFTDSVDNLNLNDCGKVRAVERTIPKTKAPATAALAELFKGATEDEIATGLSPAFGENSSDVFLSVKVKNGAAYVNLRKSIKEKMNFISASCGGLTFHSSVFATLRQFPTIKRVYYAIEGSYQDYYDWTQSDCPEELKGCSN